VISAEELRGVEDRAVREAVALQQEVGLRSVTDGEFRRATWHMDFVYQIGGIGKAPGNLVSTFHNERGDIEFTPDAIRVGRRVSMDKTIFGEDFAFLQSIAGESVPKLTIPAPSMVHYRSRIRAVVDESVYPDVEEFWTDLSVAYAEEVAFSPKAVGRRWSRR
jgi:5-methyltetrahydropteroyltriglutamate--homocysteine methyltransferase